MSFIFLGLSCLTNTWNYLNDAVYRNGIIIYIYTWYTFNANIQIDISMIRWFSVPQVCAVWSLLSHVLLRVCGWKMWPSFSGAYFHKRNFPSLSLECGVTWVRPLNGAAGLTSLQAARLSVGHGPARLCQWQVLGLRENFYYIPF